MVFIMVYITFILFYLLQLSVWFLFTLLDYLKPYFNFKTLKGHKILANSVQKTPNFTKISKGQQVISDFSPIQSGIEMQNCPRSP